MEGPFVDRLSDAMTSVSSKQRRASGRGVGWRRGGPDLQSEEGKRQKKKTKGTVARWVMEARLFECEVERG